MQPFVSAQTLVELLETRAREQADAVAFRFVQNGTEEIARLTFGELDRQARAIAANLQARGAAGQRALLLYPPGLDFIPAFFGCLYAGVVAVPAYPPRPGQGFLRLKAIIEDCAATVVLSTKAIVATFDPKMIAATFGVALQALATDDHPGDADAWRVPELRAETLAFLQYTSGSTGNPKGVMVSHGNLLHNEEMIRRAFRHDDNTIVVGWLPTFHDMGLIGNVLQPIYLGRPCILMSPIGFIQHPIGWLRAIAHYRATTSGAPDFAYALCARKVKDAQKVGLDLSTWSLAFNGAEPVRAEILDRFCEAFAPCGFRREAFYPCYGLAEATLLVSGRADREPPVVAELDASSLAEHRVVRADATTADRRFVVSSGCAWGDQRIAIVDPATQTECPPGQVGEIWIAGPSVAPGYWNRPDETAATFHACLTADSSTRFLRTGDLGFVRDGEVFVTGRLKDVIIIRGRNHYPHDIESTVQQIDPVLRPGGGAAFALDVDGAQELVILQEVQREVGVQLDPEQLIQTIRQTVARDHGLRAHAIVLVRPGSISKTSSGKIQRHACRNDFLNGKLEPVVTAR